MRRLHSNLLFSPNEFNYFKIRSIFDSFHQQSDNNGRFRLFRPELRNETLTVRISSPSPTFYANFMQIRRSVELSSNSTRKNSSENLRPTATPDDSVGWSPPPMTLRAADRGEGGGQLISSRMKREKRPILAHSAPAAQKMALASVDDIPPVPSTLAVAFSVNSLKLNDIRLEFHSFQLNFIEIYF